MGWKKAKERYDAGPALTNKNAEDLLARRVLKGLGIPTKAIWDAERHLFGETKADDALWPRVREILRATWFDYGRGHQFNGKPVIIALEASNTAKAALKRLNDEEVLPRPQIIFFVRQKGTRIAHAITHWPKNEMVEVLTPPYTVIGRLECAPTEMVISQNLDTFIKQFGPYDYAKSDE